MDKRLSIIFCIFLAISLCNAEKYYIDPVNGNDTSAGTSEAQAWRTITKANEALVAGDTVYIKAGTYTTTISPSNSGTSSNPIAYMNFGTDTVTISEAVYGMRLDGKSWIVVIGITMTNVDRFLYMGNGSNYNIIAWCTFDNARLTNGQTATWAGSRIYGNSQHNRIHHCQFSNYGYYTDDDIGCVLDIGSESNPEDSTRYNLIEGCHFFHGGHHVVGVYGKYNVIRNNWFHNEPWSMGTADSDRGAVLYGNRNLSFSGYSENGGRTLFEGNRVGYSADPSDNNGASGMAMNSSDNIVRFNTYFGNISAGLSMSLTSSYLQDIMRNKVYHNTFYNNGHNPYDPTDHMSSGIGFGIYSGSLVIEDNALKNNLLYKHRIPIGEYNINTSDRTGIIAVQVFANNWDGDTQGDPAFANEGPDPGDPMDSTLPDLHLTASSPCIDSGTYLTVVVSAGGSGTSFQVADAGYFMDGWGISGVDGDEIQLFGTTQRARITAINYQTNAVTVDRSVTWTQNQGVCMVYEGAAPDVGAYEYGSGIFIRPEAQKMPFVKEASSYGVYTIQGRKIGVIADMDFNKGNVSRYFGLGIYFTVNGEGGARNMKKIVVIR